MIKTPFNYTGGKYKLLPQLLPLFPKDINIFIDAFCGGGSILANVDAYKTYAIDSLAPLVQMHQYIKQGLIAVNSINKIIDTYKLNKTNKEAYLSLRKDYNLDPDPVKLFALICHSFSNSIRFNSNGGFNVPFGERTFNGVMQVNLKDYSNILREKNIEFISDSAFNFMYSRLGADDFIYFDPPYLITDANYNSSWGEAEEKRLLKLLDKLTSVGIRWGLSNVLTHKGKSNNLLIEWSKDKNVHHLSCSYKNCNYQTSRGGSDEVFILNEVK